MFQWAQGSFDTVTAEGRFRIDGLVYKGLGLERVADFDGDTFFEDWDVTHIASGHRLGTIAGLDEEEALKLASLIADLADWRADGPEELLKADPQLMIKLAMLSDLTGGTFIPRGIDMVVVS